MNRKVAPWPGVDSTQMRPPRLSTIFLNEAPDGHQRGLEIVSSHVGVLFQLAIGTPQFPAVLCEFFPGRVLRFQREVKLLPSRTRSSSVLLTTTRARATVSSTASPPPAFQEATVHLWPPSTSARNQPIADVADSARAVSRPEHHAVSATGTT